MAHIAIFCGGRGATSILQTLVAPSDRKVSVFINGFDDGLSTGYLRRLFPEMLGPSDFRKVSHVLGTDAVAIFKLNMRAPLGAAVFGALEFTSPVVPVVELKRAIEQRTRLEYDATKPEMSVGNLVFAALYLRYGFQSAVDRYAEICGVPSNVRLVAVSTLPATLVARTAPFGIVAPEFAISESVEALHSVFIVPEAHAYPSRLAEETLRVASLVLYAPGTFWSSLAPSLKILSRQLAQTAVPRVMVANARRSPGMQGMHIQDVIAAVERSGGTVTSVLLDPDSELVGGNPQIDRVRMSTTVDWPDGIHNGAAVEGALQTLGWL
jgi:2-phospho-L-lactate transferase/gluconeogenesis factor (CofD/UPF0052 family)